ncbi:L,D-transpeptidase [Nocardia jejuensis]|uniref:L,D-transpeptidase n=1 Tax=Nocardia jejuensis TaxID=328049 RepID=UPI00082ED9FF|nr:Ig-like domain-containing protein [Nocardia jejuensis]
MQPHRFRSIAATSWLMALIAVLVACSSSPASNPMPGGTPAPAPPAITVTPQQGSERVDPSAPVEVSTSTGILSAVTMTNEDGRVIEGTLTPDKATWKPNEQLGYGHTYTIKAEGMAVTGTTGPVTATFSTTAPSNQTKVYLNTTGGQSLEDGGTYGVGTVIVAHFDEAIGDRAAAEKRMVVTAEPKVDGAWYWMDDQNAHWRPEHYWAPGTKVTVAAKLYGLEVGPGLFGQEDSRTSFTIGAAHVSIADDNTHMVDVFENGNLIRSMPTSMGRGGSETIGGKTISFWTQPGVYTVMDKANPVIMDSSTYGLPINSRLGYKEAIGWATRISSDGIYLHALDSTIWAQGSSDVSHGCLNLSSDNARWFFDYSVSGDVVEVRNTGGAPLEVWQNGDWGLPWDQWTAGSALR